MSQEHVAFVGVQLLWLFTGVLLVLTIKVYRVRVRSTVGLILVGLLLGFLLTSLYGDPHITEVRGPDFYRIALGIAIAFNSLIVIAMRWTHGSRRTTGGGLVTFLAILSLLFDLYTLMGIGTGSFLIRQ